MKTETGGGGSKSNEEQCFRSFRFRDEQRLFLEFIEKCSGPYPERRLNLLKPAVSLDIVRIDSDNIDFSCSVAGSAIFTS